MQHFWDYSPSALKIEKNNRNMEQLPREKRLKKEHKN